MTDTISNQDLTLESIPFPTATWDEIERFALTFDGYAAAGSFEACAEIANAQRRETLTDLRTCLFFEQRRWRHLGGDPDCDSLAYIRGLVREIRAKVVASDVR